MLEVFGSQYVIDHVVAEHNIRSEQKTYRVYVTDVLKAIAESWGSEIYYRYQELITPPTEEEQTADEIVMDIIRRAGLEVSEE